MSSLEEQLKMESTLRARFEGITMAQEKQIEYLQNLVGTLLGYILEMNSKK